MSTPNPVLLKHGSYSLLPPELIHVLNQAYFLHLLATDPQKVVPPGKTLLSVMTQAQIGLPEDGKKQEEALLNRVKEVAHKAFWNEAIESLSSPLPSVQIIRLKSLYGDLLEALNPLFPPQHLVIKTLEAPLPPTSSPLHSTIAFLKEILAAIQQRCAPARDKEVNQIYRKLDEYRDPQLFNRSSYATEGPSESKNWQANLSSPSPASPAAQLVIDAMKSIISLAEVMRSDLNTAILGSLSETQLHGVVIRHAKGRERELVLQIWDDNQGELLRERWRSWIAQLRDSSVEDIPQDRKWILRLVSALGSDKPVSCDFPTPNLLSTADHAEDSQSNTAATTLNDLPPQFFMTVPKLLYIQNYLQAAVITASLRSLTRLPPSRPNGLNTAQLPPGHDFIHRVWTLLKAEIDGDEASAGVNVGETKLINLADEVIRARQLSSASGSIDAAEESQLRASVERTLRPQDPVFLLLQKRLMDAVGKQLLSNASTSEPLPLYRSGGMIPETLKTGREREHPTAGKRPRLIFPEGLDSSPVRNLDNVIRPPVIKGFEDPVLLNAIEDVFRRLTKCMSWVESVWGDLV